MNLTSHVAVSGQQTLSSSSTQLHALGTRGVTRDGRVYRYCKAGGTALVVGNVIQASAQLVNHDDGAVLAAAVGATTVSVTPGATGGAANLYAEGLAIISTTPGLGYAYGIKSHPAITASTEFVLSLYPDEPIQVALTTSSKLDLIANPYSAVIQAPVTTLTGAIVGVACYPIVASEWGWIQTWGPGGVLINGTPAVANLVSSPAAAAGAAAINSTTLAIVGQMMVTGVDTKVQGVFISINP